MFNEVAYVPTLSINIISAGQMKLSNIHEVIVKDERRLIHAARSHPLAVFKFEPVLKLWSCIPSHVKIKQEVGDTELYVSKPKPLAAQTIPKTKEGKFNHQKRQQLYDDMKKKRQQRDERNVKSSTSTTTTTTAPTSTTTSTSTKPKSSNTNMNNAVMVEDDAEVQHVFVSTTDQGGDKLNDVGDIKLKLLHAKVGHLKLNKECRK